MLLEVATLPKPDKAFKDFCNNLRCPLCDSQLDGNIHPKEAKLYCVGNNDEYKSFWIPGQDEPSSEVLKFWYPQYEYVISVARLGSNHYKTLINRYNLDVIPFYRASTRKEVFNYDGPRILFFRCRMEENVFLKKLKTYIVFS